jgi:molybdopterin-guanine dinucleotide biosynthesis protein A
VKGYVLAGGLSSRMGTDKARLPCRGLPMALAVAEEMQLAGVEPFLVRRRDDGLPWVNRAGTDAAVVWENDDGPVHPLNGVCSALSHGVPECVLVAPCDLPGLRAEHLQLLLAAGPCVAVGPDGRPHPLLAVFPPERLGWVRTLVHEHGRAQSAVEGLLRVELPVEALRNANRPEDRPPSPIAALAVHLPPGVDVARVVGGERERQRARGIVEPPFKVMCGAEEAG